MAPEAAHLGRAAQGVERGSCLHWISQKQLQLLSQPERAAEQAGDRQVAGVEVEGRGHVQGACPADVTKAPTSSGNQGGGKRHAERLGQLDIGMPAQTPSDPASPRPSAEAINLLPSDSGF